MSRQKYHTHARLREELEELSHAHPALCSLYSLGTSSQGRDILAVKITQVATDSDDDSDGVMLYYMIAQGADLDRPLLRPQVKFVAGEIYIEVPDKC